MHSLGTGSADRQLHKQQLWFAANRASEQHYSRCGLIANFGTFSLYAEQTYPHAFSSIECLLSCHPERLSLVILSEAKDLTRRGLRSFADAQDDNRGMGDKRRG